MDYNQYTQDNNPNNFNQNYYQNPTPPKKNNGFAIASLICGIVSLILCCTGFSFPLGALGIIFAVLTFRKGKKMDSMTLTGLITSVAGLAIGLFMIISVIFTTVTMWDDPNFRESLDEAFEQTYGMDLEEFMEEYSGIDMY